MLRFAIQYQRKVASMHSAPAVLPRCSQPLLKYSTGRARQEQVLHIAACLLITQKHFLPFGACPVHTLRADASHGRLQIWLFGSLSAGVGQKIRIFLKFSCMLFEVEMSILAIILGGQLASCKTLQDDDLRNGLDAVVRAQRSWGLGVFDLCSLSSQGMGDVGREGGLSILVQMHQHDICQVITVGMVWLYLRFAYVEIILLYSSCSNYSLDEFEISISYHTQEYALNLQGNFKIRIQQHVILLHMHIMQSDSENNQCMQN
ncbi:hypothetical protein SS50377_28495 [Spironucleus salmonicida]|uniref:Uncharacterized protein n=1 Tax=Spironucleus salmonicida TaxID=348837 RepID=V6LD52_9EUKA|nr:hypothetical protein SS50377_28495 [Spironucleus salmonicida]|eukprot:EST42402.1 Hypothetical protein SS50377_18049 [Spironucleus salmonicida]